MRILIPAAFTLPLLAGELELSVEIPRMNVAEYHRPYVAIWVEGADQKFAANLAVWYELQTNKAEKGTTWLKDIRQWWRKSGRELTMPVDGVSGATRAPGVHRVSLTKAIAKLPPGSYSIVVEAAREVGGRELVKIPFQWSNSTATPAKAKGEHELGQIQLSAK